jgi:two-component system chemotaxis response regulator CheB
VELYKGMPYKGLRPSANYLFHSLAYVYGPHAMGIVLTGMGDDGSEGLLALRQAGGHTVAQDPKTCVVYGMPAAAIACDAVDQVLTLDQMSWLVSQLLHHPSKVVSR